MTNDKTQACPPGPPFRHCTASTGPYSREAVVAAEAWIKGGAPTSAERELAHRVADFIETHDDEFTEARGWEEGFFVAPPRKEPPDLPEGFEPWCPPPESRDFRRMSAMRDAVLGREAHDALEMQENGWSLPEPEDEDARDVWARRVVHFFWLLTEPLSEWTGGPYTKDGLTSDRDSAYILMESPVRQKLMERVTLALDSLCALHPLEVVGDGTETGQEKQEAVSLNEEDRDATALDGDEPGENSGKTQGAGSRGRSALSREQLDGAAANLAHKHPNWTSRRIAEELGVAPSRLSDSRPGRVLPTFSRVREIQQAERQEQEEHFRSAESRDSLPDRDG